MKKKAKSFVLTVLSLILVLSFVQPVAAQTACLPVKTNSVMSYYNTLFNILAHVWLSEREVTLKVKETHEIVVSPCYFAKMFGWELKSVVSDNRNVSVCISDKKPLCVVVTGTHSGNAVLKLYLENTNFCPTRIKVLTYHITVKSSSSYSSGGGSHCSTVPEPEKPDTEKPEPGKPDTEKPEPGKPDTEKPEPGKPDTDLKKFDTQNWRFDENTFSFSYDGKSHLPTLLGIPDEVEIIWPSEEFINAKDYTISIGFKVPEGYEAVPNMETTFKISPSVVTSEITFDNNLNSIVALVNGIAKADISDYVVKYLVNGEESDNPPVISEPGMYTTSAEVSIKDETKANNYSIMPNTSETVVNVKRSEPWYKLSVEFSQEGNNITISIYIVDVKIPEPNDFFVNPDDSFSMLTVGLDIGYDRNLLAFESFSYDEELWIDEPFYNPERDESGVNDFVGIFYSDDPLPESLLLGEITYQTIDEADLNNIQFTLTNSNVNNGLDGFIYTADDETIIINKTDDFPEEQTVYIDWNLQKDASYEYPDPDDLPEGYPDEETAKEILQEYIDNDFQKFDFGSFGFDVGSEDGEGLSDQDNFAESTDNISGQVETVESIDVADTTEESDKDTNTT